MISGVGTDDDQVPLWKKILKKLKEWWDSLDEPAFEFSISSPDSRTESKIKSPAVSFSIEPGDDEEWEDEEPSDDEVDDENW